jgi:hypothetical protein
MNLRPSCDGECYIERRELAKRVSSVRVCDVLCIGV